MRDQKNNNKKNYLDIEEPKAPDNLYGARHTQVLLLFGLMVLAYGTRVNLSVGIVAMTDPRASSNLDIPTFSWKNNSVILSSFFWGYVIPQIAAGYLSKKYGAARWFLLGAMLMNSIFSLLIPYTANNFGSIGVMICRALQGFSQGFMFPSVHTLMSKWAPLSERSRMGTFVYTGGPFGTVLALPITGWISASHTGWPAVFYLYGACGLIWTVMYFIFGAESPAQHKKISVEEKYYIEKSLGHENGYEQQKTPWSTILTSLPVWAILIAHCGQNWGFWTLLTEIPTYMSHVLNYDIKSNGLLSAAPYFILWLLGFVFSPIADKLIISGRVSITAARKAMTTIGLGIPALTLICLSFVNPEKIIVMALLIIAVGFNSAIYCGFNINHIDLSPNHAGTLMGITNGISNICSLVAPLVVQFIVTNESDVAQWRTVFLLSAGVYVVANIFYTVFGSGELQLWDSIEQKAKLEAILESKKSKETNL